MRTLLKIEDNGEELRIEGSCRGIKDGVAILRGLIESAEENHFVAAAIQAAAATIAEANRRAMEETEKEDRGVPRVITLKVPKGGSAS